jgi:hypothetical protein
MTNNNNNNQIALDNNNNIVYNTSMTNNNTNKGNDMINKAHDVQVIKHIGTSYDVYANFTTVQDALDYMRKMLPNANDSWYIVNADGVRLRLNAQNKLEVFHSLIG